MIVSILVQWHSMLYKLFFLHYQGNLAKEEQEEQEES